MQFSKFINKVSNIDDRAYVDLCKDSDDTRSTALCNSQFLVYAILGPNTMNRQAEFNSWTKRLAFHFVQMSVEKAWISAMSKW